MKNLIKNIGRINLLGFIVVTSFILPLLISLTVKVLNTQNIIW